MRGADGSGVIRPGSNNRASELMEMDAENVKRVWPSAGPSVDV